MQDWEKSNYEVYLELQHSQESELMHYRTKGALNKKVAQYIKDGGKLINGKIVYAKKSFNTYANATKQGLDAASKTQTVVTPFNKEKRKIRRQMHEYEKAASKHDGYLYGKDAKNYSSLSAKYKHGLATGDKYKPKLRVYDVSNAGTALVSGAVNGAAMLAAPFIEAGARNIGRKSKAFKQAFKKSLNKKNNKRSK